MREHVDLRSQQSAMGRMSLYIPLNLLLAVLGVPSFSPLFNESIQPLYKTRAMGLRQVAAAIVSPGASWNEMRHFTEVNRMARVGRHTLRVRTQRGSRL